MKSYLKYGFLTLLGWNLFVSLLVVITSWLKGTPFTKIFDDGTNGIAMTFFLVLWSCIWFGIGYTSRKKYLLNKQLEQETAPSVDKSLFDKLYRDKYISGRAGMLSLVFLTAIPWYILGYGGERMQVKDGCIISVLAILCLLSFIIYLIKKM